MDDNLELYHKYRPTCLKEVIGQPMVIQALEEMLKNKRLPHALLLVGPSGTGKTTIARILQKELKCSDSDFNEINAADTRGIETVREIRRAIGYKAMGGDNRIWLIDECFHPGTLIDCLDGNRKIDSLKVGDVVYNLSGVGVVEKVITNPIDLDRVIKLTFDDGSIVVTTVDHEFFTENGWIHAKDLSSEDCILRRTCYPMDRKEVADEEGLRDLSERLRDEGEKEKDLLPIMWMESESKIVREGLDGEKKETEADIDLQVLSSEVHDRNKRIISPSRMLLETMRRISEGTTEWRGAGINGEVSLVSEYNLIQGVTAETVLQQIMRCSGSKHIPRVAGASLQSNSIQEVEQEVEIISEQHYRRFDAEEKGFGEDEGFKSIERSESSGEDAKYEGSSRDFTRMEGGAWRQREDYKASDDIARSSEETGFILGTRSKCLYQRENQTRREENLSICLQSGFGIEAYKARGRSRWETPSTEKDYIVRQKEGEKIRRVRLVRSEIYKRGCNESSFVGFVSDQNKNDGFVEFIDLQISNNPSYFVSDGIPVHNCHKITSDAQTALLKILEDTPRHVYFILCTTELRKILPTIKNRCTLLQLNALKPKNLSSIITSVLSKEKAKLSEEVIDALVEASEGSARQLLVTLHQIIGLDSEEDQLAAVKNSKADQVGRSIAQALLDTRVKWPDIAKIIKSTDEEPETVRRMILGYMTALMLNNHKNLGRAYAIINAFETDFYASGKAGLVRACFDVINTK